jgi:hypothetical protein
MYLKQLTWMEAQHCSQLHEDSFFTDINEYNLVLYVETPAGSHVDTSFLSSPLATLGRYQGLSSDPEAPEWTRMRSETPIVFRQPRGAMAEVFMIIAFWPENATIVSLNIYLVFWMLLSTTSYHSRILRR